MGKIAYVFPGQGSQKVGMGQDVAEQYPVARRIFDLADEKLGYPLSALCFTGPEEELKLTVHTQPALLTTSIALYKAMIEEIEQLPDFVAGHSLGEYSALVAAGAISFQDAVFVVQKRGQLMEEAVPAGIGAMSAVLGLDRERLADICQAISREGNQVELANLNCPGQIVISGHQQAVQQAGEEAKASGARRVVPLSVSGPFHSSLMEPAASQLKQTLSEIDLQHAKVPVVANVSAQVVEEAEMIRQALVDQVTSPVLWEDSIRFLLEQGVDQFVEIGPGKVLTGLIKKVNRKAKTWNVADVDSLKQVVNALR